MTVRSHWQGRIILALGGALVILYAIVPGLGSLREHTAAFLIVYSGAFLVYGAAALMAIRVETLTRQGQIAIFVLAVAMQVPLVINRPTLSDDMYRYIWDGRVQAHGISPYQYPPDASELRALRDPTIWPYINRKSAVTIYPPAAQAAFALLWRIWPDSVRWFQIVAAAGCLFAGTLLLGLLRDLGRSPARLVIFLWSPLLLFETAHAAHLEGLMLPLVMSALWARVRERDGLLGVLLGLATALKLYPALLFPALWRPDHRRGRWLMPLTFGLTLAGCYLPYLLVSGNGVLGFLPNYFREQFNISPLVHGILYGLARAHLDPRRSIVILTLGILAVSALAMTLRPARSAESALRRCMWLIGVMLLFSQNLFAWYTLWLLPLVAIFVQPAWAGFALDGWTGWFLFCGLVGLSYTFFIDWKPVQWAIYAQFLPLYGFLLVDALKRGIAWKRSSQPAMVG